MFWKNVLRLCGINKFTWKYIFGNTKIWIGHGNINSLDFEESVSAFLRPFSLIFTLSVYLSFFLQFTCSYITGDKRMYVYGVLVEVF